MAVTPAPIENSAAARRPWWRWLLLALLVLIYALVFGEFFLRLLSPQALVPRYVTAGSDGVRANMPGASFRQWTPEVDVTVHYNAAGQRDDRPPPGPKVAGDCRVALLGDSYFVGFESSYADSFAARLEQALAARGRQCRVINFAVSGFGDAENLRILESRVKRYQPDLVVMSVHQTDGMDNLRANLFTLGPDGLEPTGNSYLPGVGISDRLNRYASYRFVQENSHLYAALREWAGIMGKRVLATIRLQSADDEATEEASDDNPENGGDGNGGEKGAVLAPDQSIGGTLPAWVGNPELNARLVLAIDEESRLMGAPLLLFEIPSSSSRSRYVGVMDRLFPAGLPGDIHKASPLERFRQMASPTTQFYLERGQRHWTALGNRVAADVAADAIIAQKLLPADDGSTRKTGADQSRP